MAKLTFQQRAVLMNEGAVKGSQTLVDQGAISKELAQDIMKATYKTILEEIQEARREIVRIQSSLNMMENYARQASCNQGRSGNDHRMMTEHLITLDAWVVSLLETVLTVTGILNPSHTRKKIDQLATSMHALMDKRAAEQHPVLDDSSLFRDYVDR